MLGKLGVYLGPADQLIESSPFNARGLRVAARGRVLQRRAAAGRGDLGGTWDDAPPRVESIETLGASLLPAVDDWFGDHEAGLSRIPVSV
jgi:hypothetical protein